MGKETILRVIKNDPREGRVCTPHEVITTFHRKDESSVVFSCTLNSHMESLLEEDCNADGNVVLLRFRYLTTPPPLLTLARYEKVTMFRISCVGPVAWLFGIFVQLPSLESVSFGTGCFEDEKYDWKEQYNIKLEQCPHVKELKIETNVTKFHGLDSDSQKIVKNRIYAILDNARTSFPKLQKVDFVLPLVASLDRFLDHFIDLKNIGLTTIDNASGKRTYKANLFQHQRAQQSLRPGHSRRASGSHHNPTVQNTQKITKSRSTSDSFTTPIQADSVSGSDQAGGGVGKKRKKEPNLHPIKREPDEPEPELIDLIDSDDESPANASSEYSRRSKLTKPVSPSLLSDT